MSLHVVFGAGQIGAALARSLAAAGHSVRVVRRSERPVGPGIEVMAGDAMDPAFATRACQDARVIYHCMNPSAYEAAAWQDEFPRQGRALIQAALSSGALLVCLDNLYGYGIAERRTEDSPMAATGPKGKVRVEWDATLRGTPGLRFAVGRAGDFFGPGTGDQSLFSPRTVASIRQGGTAWLVGDVQAVHAFRYVPDVVAGLKALGEAEVEGVFHLPVVEVAPAELVAKLGAAAGARARARALPGWAVSALAPFVPLMRELKETLYQWDRPFRVDDARFRARFPGFATSLDEAVRATVAAVQAPHRLAARSQFGANVNG